MADVSRWIRFSRRRLWSLLPLLTVISLTDAAQAETAPPADVIRAGTAAGVHGRVELGKVAYLAADRAVGYQLGSGAPVFLGDQIITGADSGLQVMLADETVLTLGQNARLTIDDMVYDPASGKGKLSMQVARGAFRFVSGRIAQQQPENVRIGLPVGTIGIRGTIVGGYVEDNRAVIALLGPGASNDSGQRFGAIIVTGGSGTVELSRSGYATELRGGATPSPPAPLTGEQRGLLQQASSGAPAQRQTGGGTSPPPATSTAQSSSSSSAQTPGSSPTAAADSNSTTASSDSGSTATTGSTTDSSSSTTTTSTTAEPVTLAQLSGDSSSGTATTTTTTSTTSSATTSSSATAGSDAAGLNTTTSPTVTPLTVSSPQATQTLVQTTSTTSSPTGPVNSVILLDSTTTGYVAGWAGGGYVQVSNSTPDIFVTQASDGTISQMTKRGTGTGTMTLSGGTVSTLYNDSMIAMGYWAQGTVTATNGFFSNFAQGSTQATRFIVAVPASGLPTSGSATYSQVAASPVTWTTGGLGSGTATGNMIANFSGSTVMVGVKINITMPGDATYTIGTPNGTAGATQPVSLTNGTFSYTNTYPTSAAFGSSGQACSAGCVVNINGMLAGSGGSAAGVVFNISSGTTNNGTTQFSTLGLQGGIVFKKN